MDSIKHRTIFFAMATLLCAFLLPSCVLKKTSIKPIQSEDKESIILDFDIVLKEVDDVRDMKIREYRNHQIQATLKHTNQTDTTIKVDSPAFIVYENYEIMNIRGLERDSLIGHYDYSIVFDPETYNDFIISIQPNEFTIDTLNLVNDFNFYLSGPDTLLIRIKKDYFDDYLYSNWDTLIIR